MERNVKKIEMIYKNDDENRAVLLWKALREYANKENKKPLNWESVLQPKWYFYYSHKDREFYFSWDTVQNPFTVYFTSKDIAKETVRVFNGELVWYFEVFSKK